MSDFSFDPIVTGPESTNNEMETNMDNQFKLENDGVTELDMTPATSGRAGDPKVVTTNSLTILGQGEIEVASFDTGSVRFGKTEGIKEYVTLNYFGEILGFLNAVGDTLDGVYPVLKRGFHSKREEGDFDFVDKVESDYVNFDSLRDLDTLKMLIEHGIERKQGGWTVLRVKNYKLGPQYHVNPMKDKELVEAAQMAKMERLVDAGDPNPAIPTLTAEELVIWRRNNDKAWAQVNKHKGLDLLVEIAEGKRAVLLAYKPMRNTSTDRAEFERRTIDAKIFRLFGTREVRAEAKRESIERAQSRAFVENGARMIQRNTGGIADAANRIISQDIRVFVAGQEVDVAAERLIGTSIRYLEAGERTRHMPFLANLNQVKGSLAFASQKGWAIEVVSGLK